MEAPNLLPRFSSCRGVTFEAKSPDVSSLAPPTPDGGHNGRWVWLPWASHAATSAVFPLSLNQAAIMRSLSRPSSHFCDLDDQADDENQDEHDDVEVAKQVDQPLQTIENMRNPSVRKPKPPSKESRLSVILLDQGLFTVYKRLFLLSFALNITALVLAATGNFPYAEDRPALFAMGNILALTLCRSETFLRVVFWLAVKLFGRPWIPLFIKTAVTSFLQSVGGIHSS